MKVRTEGQIQKIIDLEIILILIVIGLDILIETLIGRNWIATSVILVGLCVIGALYWHKLHLDRFLIEFEKTLHHIFPINATTPPTPQTIPLPAASVDAPRNIPMTTVADRPIIRVSNFLLSKNFYAQVLAPLGYSLTTDFPALGMASFGIGISSDLWIKGGSVEQKLRAAFCAAEKNMVDDFFDAALDAGGQIAEVPGPRPDRGSGYYAAAILDPDGYTIEAFFHNASDATDGDYEK